MLLLSIYLTLTNIKIIYKKIGTSLHENKDNRCELKNKTAKIFFEKALLYEDNQCNFVSSCWWNEKKNKKARVIAGLSIRGNNEIRLLTFMFINNKTKKKKKN